MIQIFLDGLQAAVPDKTSIKFTAENPYFTKTSSYTYEIELPLSISANRMIFGWIDRLDVDISTRTMSARLVVDNRTILVGTAHVTSVSNTSVKVQLLGSEASYNYGNKMAETYINELDLGDWLTTTFPDLYPEGTRFSGTTAPILAIERFGLGNRPGISGTGSSSPGLSLSYPMGAQPWVAFPVVNSTADIKCNDFAFYEQTEGRRDFIMKLRSYSGTRVASGRPNDDSPVDSFAVQPYIWFMAEKIAEATGFTLSHDDNYLFKNPFFKRIFIANANNCIECNKCLPHWSVNEWWTEIENTFGVVMTVDYADMSMKLMSRKEYYIDMDRERRFTFINRVLDEYSVEVDDDTQSDISVSNVGFSDFENGREDLLSEFIINNAKFSDGHPGVSSLLDSINVESGDRKERYRATVFRCDDGRQFIYSLDCGADSADRLEKADTGSGLPDTNGGRFEFSTASGKGEGLAEVNMFRPRMARDESEDVDVQLRFVPARTVFVDADLYLKYSRHPGAVDKDTPVASFQVTAIERPDRGDMEWYKDKAGDEIDIEAVIAGDEDEQSDSESSTDLIYIAIDNPEFDSHDVNVKIGESETLQRQFTYPRAIIRERTMGLIGDGVKVTDPGVSLSLIPIEGQTNLASETLTDSVSIDTLNRYCIKFIADSIPDVGSVFNIRNRLFVCEKIEADISVAGLGRMLTGYFYKITL